MLEFLMLAEGKDGFYVPSLFFFGALMVRYFHGPIVSLHDAVRARRHLWFVCFNCGRNGWMDPRDMAHRYGALTFKQVCQRGRCQTCRVKGRMGVIPNDEECWHER